MPRILSDRAQNTDQVVVLPASLEDPAKPPPGLYRVGVTAVCVSVFALFAALTVAYYVRSRRPPFWEPIELPPTLWLSTALILASGVTFEAARRVFRRGRWRLASNLLLVTASLGAAFLASQLTAWRTLVLQGAFLSQNPHSSFFYLFTGIHAAHLVGGLVALFVLVLGRARRRELVDVVAFYWHFLGALWVALFAVLHLIP
jgi:cytochrome c oxidase subunit 3